MTERRGILPSNENPIRVTEEDLRIVGSSDVSCLLSLIFALNGKSDLEAVRKGKMVNFTLHTPTTVSYGKFRANCLTGTFLLDGDIRSFQAPKESMEIYDGDQLVAIVKGISKSCSELRAGMRRLRLGSRLLIRAV